MLGAQQLVGAVEPGAGKPEAPRQRQRLARARRAGRQPVGRAAGAGVELHGGADGSLGLERRRRELRQMGGDEEEAAALDERFEERDRQRRALLGIGARAQLVEQDQGVGTGGVPRLAEPQQPAAEGGAVGQQILIVAHGGDQSREKGQTGALRRRHRQAALMGQGEETGGLQRHRLAAGVGAGDHQGAPFRVELQVERHHRLRVARLAEGSAAQLGEARIEQRVAGAGERQP